jgi:hypothetical protein
LRDPFARLTRFVVGFARTDEGSATIEAVLWIPMFFLTLVMSLQVAQIAIGQSMMMRIVQDGNRSFALGRLDPNLYKNNACPAGSYVVATATKAEIERMAVNISRNVTIESRVNCSTRTIRTVARMPLSDLTGFRVLPMVGSTNITIQAQQVREF